ncbi:MAG: MFS transporter [Syntrophaceae bacterium]|nr:MFS transporter [Syntrophaceae bacterium]
MVQNDSKGFAIFYGWIVVAALFTIWTVVFGIQYSFGIFFRSIQDALGCSRGAISLAMTIHLLGFAAMVILAGWLNERFNIRTVYTLAAFGFGFPLALCSRISEPWQLYVLYGLLAVSTGIYGPYVYTITTRWFTTKNGLPLGLASAGAGFGSLLIAPLTNGLIATCGWRHTFIILGFASIIVLLVCARLVRMPQAASPTERDLTAMRSPDAPSPPAMTLKQAMQTRVFFLIILGSAAGQTATRAVVVHIAPHAIDVGISPLWAAIALSTIGCGSFLGRIIMGLIQDRIGPRLSMIICLATMGACLFTLPLIRLDMAFIVFAIIYGLAYGGDIPQVPALTLRCFGAASMAIIYAIISGATNVCASLGPLAAGYVFDTTQSYTFVFLGAGLLLSIGALGIFRIRSAA